MRPRLLHKATLRYPGTGSTPDPVTNRPIPGPPRDVHGVRCRLSQRTTVNVSSASEKEGASSFTTTLGDALFAKGTEVHDKVEVVDDDGVLGAVGAVWRIEGTPVNRGTFIAAALLYVSDMQEG